VVDASPPVPLASGQRHTFEPILHRAMIEETRGRLVACWGSLIARVAGYSTISME